MSRSRCCLSALVAALLVTACNDREPTRPAINAAKPGGGNGDPTVTAADPNNAPQDTTLDVRVFGTNFDRGSKAEWARSGVPSPKVLTNSTRFVSSTELVANITIALDADTGLYDVIVTASTGKKGIGTELFTVRQTGRKLSAPYDVTDLGALPGNTRSRANGMNEVGQIVGSSWDRGDPFDDPTLWTVAPGGGVTVTPLAMPVGANYAAGNAISNSGIAVGSSGVGPVYWDVTNVTRVYFLPASARANDVTVLADGGTNIAVGYSSGQAAYWEITVSSASQPVVLPPLQSGAVSSAGAVNTGGTIVGQSAGHAVVWHKDGNGAYRVCDLGTDSEARTISERTATGLVYVAGASNVSVQSVAIVWSVDLSGTTWGSPPQACSVTSARSLDLSSAFFDVNPLGEAVGEDLVSHEPILYLAVSGVLQYLKPLTKGGTINEARAISADGTRIVGVSTGAKTTTRAVLWTRRP